MGRGVLNYEWLKDLTWFKNFEIWRDIRTLLLLFLCFWRWLVNSRGPKFGVSPVRFKRSENRLERSTIPPILDPPPIFNFLCLCSPQNQHFSSVFNFSAIFRPNGLGRPPQTLTFQYRTPRSRLVIPSPRDFSAENVFWTQLFGEFQVAVFPVPKICLDIRTFRILKVLISRGPLY